MAAVRRNPWHHPSFLEVGLTEPKKHDCIETQFNGRPGAKCDVEGSVQGIEC